MFFERWLMNGDFIYILKKKRTYSNWKLSLFLLNLPNTKSEDLCDQSCFPLKKSGTWKVKWPWTCLDEREREPLLSNESQGTQQHTALSPCRVSQNFFFFYFFISQKINISILFLFSILDVNAHYWNIMNTLFIDRLGKQNC